MQTSDPFRTADQADVDRACVALAVAIETIADTAQRLSDEFVRRLRGMLRPAEWAEMRQNNAETRACRLQTCASHDYVDANEVMAPAFVAVVGHEPVGSFETHYDPAVGHHVADDPAEEARADANTALWNAAWAMAKRDHLTDHDLADQLENATA